MSPLALLVFLSASDLADRQLASGDDTVFMDYRARGQLALSAAVTAVNGSLTPGVVTQLQFGYQLKHGLFPEVSGSIVRWAQGSAEPGYATTALGLRWYALRYGLPQGGAAWGVYGAAGGGVAFPDNRHGATRSATWLGSAVIGCEAGATSPHGGLPLLTASAEVSWTQLPTTGWLGVGLGLGLDF
jgi:hypothetical protein